jgi:GNAT superfamily N-acetyltransferase
LLRAAPFRVEYSLDLRPGWRDEPDLRAGVDVRITAARAAGMRPLVERLVYIWTPDDGLPERPGHLDFHPEQDDDVLFDVLRRIHVGTLDGHAQQDIRRSGPEAAAHSELEFMRWMPSPPQWWRLAYTPGGELVGLTVPGRNYTTPIVALIGVVPEHRGHNYSYDLLVECTHILAEHGAVQIKAATDAGNRPMASSFARAGYPITVERTTLDWADDQPVR